MLIATQLFQHRKCSAMPYSCPDLYLRKGCAEISTISHYILLLEERVCLEEIMLRLEIPSQSSVEQDGFYPEVSTSLLF